MTPEEHNAFVRGYRIGLARGVNEVKNVIETSGQMFSRLQVQIEDSQQLLKQARTDMWRLQMIDRAREEQRPNILQ